MSFVMLKFIIEIIEYLKMEKVGKEPLFLDFVPSFNQKNDNNYEWLKNVSTKEC